MPLFHSICVASTLPLLVLSLPDFSSYQYPDAPTPLRTKPEYEFCIVGTGTAGSVLANRLSETGKNTVVALEAGTEPDQQGTWKPSGGNQFGLNGDWSLLDYNFNSVPQIGLKNRTLAYHRGKAVGGSSVTNGEFYGLGSKAIYDSWEAAGNPGWNWEAIQKAAKRGTKFVGNPAHSTDDTFMTWDDNNYGTKGPLKIGFQGYIPTSNPSFMKALEAVNVSVVNDQNGGNPVGIKQGTMTLDENFERSSAYDSYLKVAQGRSNLDVLPRAIVVKLIFDESTIGTGKLRATGLTYLDNNSGIFHNVSCTKEVILSAGAFHSPFLLKQNGIGPQAELQNVGIEPIIINDNVGGHMQDHASFSVIHKAKPELAHTASTQDLTQDMNILNHEQQVFYSGTQPRWTSKWSSPSGCTNGLQEMTDEELESIGAGDVITAGLVNQAHNEYLYESVYYPQVNSERYGRALPNTSYISVTINNMVALSKGSVNITSPYYLTDPSINPNYLVEKADQAMAIQGVKYMRQVFAHPEMAQYSDGEVSPGPDVQSDMDLLDYARTCLIPNWHASSTCRMLPKEHGGVVDPTMRVYETINLRVCDVSTFSRLPDINLVGSVYAVAEHFAEILRKEYGDWAEGE